MEFKVGRNARCPCGSGKKFKRCCLKELKRQKPIVLRRDSRGRVPCPCATPGCFLKFRRGLVPVEQLDEKLARHEGR